MLYDPTIRTDTQLRADCYFAFEFERHGWHPDIRSMWERAFAEICKRAA